MNIFKKYKLAQQIDEKAEMLASYQTRIERFYKENLICATWVYHLSDKELQAIGLKKPWECSYLHLWGDPNPLNHNFDKFMYKKIYWGLSPEKMKEAKEADDEYSRTISVAWNWAKTIGARKVLIFKRNTENQYMSMVHEFANEIIEFVQLNKAVYGQLKDGHWEWLVRFAQNKMDELQNTSYIIVRDK